MLEFADLEIRIFSQQPEGFPVELTLNNEQQFPRGYLDPGFLPWVPGVDLGEDGERLLAWLLADKALKSAWAEVRGQQSQRRIRLRIDAAAPELHALPWELLREPGDGAAPLDLAATAATPFSRYLAGRWQPGSPVLKRPVRVLVAIANPENLKKYKLEIIDVDQEWELLQSAVANQKEVELTLLPQPCTLPALEIALKDGFHVLHFIGHGAYGQKEGEKEGKAVLYLADEANQVALTTEEDLAGMLARQLADSGQRQDDKLRLVFLASCQTAKRSPADAFRGLAPQLVAAGVPAVLAMQDLVAVETARQFAATFYRQLLDHGRVDLASNEARSAVLTAKRSGAGIPVLFSRLKGSQLFGQRGHISSGREDIFWPFLLDSVEAGQVTAFLGPGVTAGVLPDRASVARRLAEHYGYPLTDKESLVKVAQFVAVNARQDPKGTMGGAYLRLLQRGLFNFLDIQPTDAQKEQFKDATLSETVEALNWAEQVLVLKEDEIHHQLADLGLPLFLTTNVDNFMVEALKHKGLAPRRVGLRWRQPEAGTPQYYLNPPPSREDPVVLHLNGYDSDPDQLKNLVLSEDDYLQHLVRLSRDQELHLPMNVLGMLSEHSFLFLGYQLDDWEFRIILHGLLPQIAQSRPEKKRHVGVQLELRDTPSMDKAMAYLGDYLSHYNTDIYWGSSQQFVNEMHSRWQANVEAEHDDWDF